MALTDGQLVERVRNGDREAFGGLVDRYRAMVYGLGYHLTCDFEAARDLAQEAFVQAYLKMEQLREPEKFAGWLRQIAINIHRTQQRHKEVVTVTLEEANTAPDNQRTSEIEVVVQEALARLRESERLALTLHYVNGYSHAEIAGFLGVRPEAVKTRLARARAHLRTEVMAMVEDTFREKSLDESFRRDVIGMVRELELDLRKGMPSELPQLAEMVKENWQGMFAEVRRELPEQLKVRAAAGEAIAVKELPRTSAEKITRATQWLWLDRIIFHLQSHTELKDSMWVGLGRHPKGERLLRLWSQADPKAGGMRGASFPERARRYRMSVVMPHEPALASRKELQVRLVEDVRRAVAGLRAGIGAQLPVPAPELYAEVQGQFERLAVAWMEALSEEDRKRFEDSERLPVHELSRGAQEALRELVEVDWLRSVIARIAVAPEWACNLDECRVTFEAQEERTGQPGVKLECPEGSFIIMGTHGVSAESSGDPEELKAVGE